MKRSETTVYSMYSFRARSIVSPCVAVRSGLVPTIQMARIR